MYLHLFNNYARFIQLRKHDKMDKKKLLKEDEDVSGGHNESEVDLIDSTGLISASELATAASTDGSSFRYCMPTHAVYTPPVPTACIVDNYGFKKIEIGNNRDILYLLLF